METYDIVVVGGGISRGLPTAAYLQKSGLRVAVVEAKPELGNFAPTHETWPDVLDSPHASTNFSGNSPAIEDLNLESYGYRLRTSPVILGTTHRDGTNGLLRYNPELTARNFAKHSQHDAEKIYEIQGQVQEKMVEMNETAFFSPHPDPAEFEQILKTCSYIAGVPLDEMESMTGPELIEQLFESNRVRQTVLCPSALHPQGFPLARGQGAFSTILSLFYTTTRPVGADLDPPRPAATLHSQDALLSRDVDLCQFHGPSSEGIFTR